MSLRELDRCVRAYNRRIELERARAYGLASAVVAELVNITGAVNSSRARPWKTIQPATFYDAWLGKESSTPPAPLPDKQHILDTLERITRARGRKKLKPL